MYLPISNLFNACNLQIDEEITQELFDSFSIKLFFDNVINPYKEKLNVDKYKILLFQYGIIQNKKKKENQYIHTVNNKRNESFKSYDLIIEICRLYELKNNTINNISISTEDDSITINNKSLGGENKILISKIIENEIKSICSENDMIYYDSLNEFLINNGDYFLSVFILKDSLIKHRNDKELFNLETHFNIQHLTFLLRIEEFIKTNNCNNIQNIELSNSMCEFIYDYMVFFDILNFSKVDNSNNFVTTTKAERIKSLYHKFSKKQFNNFLLGDVLNKIYETKLLYIENNYIQYL